MYDCVSLRRNKVNSNGPNMFICKLIGHLQPKIPASKLIYSGCHLSSGLFVMSLGAIFLRSMASLRRKHCLRWLQKACKHFTTIRGFGFLPKKQCHWFWQKSFFWHHIGPRMSLLRTSCCCRRASLCIATLAISSS